MLLGKLVWGRWIYAVGGNPEAARLAVGKRLNVKVLVDDSLFPYLRKFKQSATSANSVSIQDSSLLATRVGRHAAASTSRLTSARTWSGPKCLSTACIRIIGGVAAVIGSLRAWRDARANRTAQSSTLRI